MDIAKFLKDYGELISITLIPIIIWFLGIRFQDRKSKQDAKMQLFLKLMANRKSTPISKEWVDSLNQIDVVFQDSPKVRNAWRNFFDSLHPKSQHFDTFQHRAGVRPYTSSYDLAEPCVFDKQSPGPFHCGQLALATFLPKLQVYFA